jgi:hypothetical protein
MRVFKCEITGCKFESTEAVLQPVLVGGWTDTHGWQHGEIERMVCSDHLKIIKKYVENLEGEK